MAETYILIAFLCHAIKSTTLFVLKLLRNKSALFLDQKLPLKGRNSEFWVQITGTTEISGNQRLPDRVTELSNLPRN